MKKLFVQVVSVAAFLVVAVGIFNLKFYQHPEHGMSEDRFWVLKTFAPERAYDIVLAGNSRVYRGLAPVVLREHFPGTRILNFGYSGGGLTRQMLDIVDGKLDPASSQRAVFLNLEPGTLGVHALANRQLNIELTRSRWHRFLCRHADPLVRFFQPINKPSLAAGRLKQLVTGAHEGAPYLYERFHEDGWVASRRIPPDPDRIYRRYVERRAVRAAEEDGAMKPQVEELMRNLLRQVRAWVDGGTKVYGLRMPVDPRVWAMETEDYDEARVVRRFQEAGGVWLGVETASFSTYDGSHLPEPEARRFTDLVGRAAAEKGSRPRPFAMAFGDGSR
jgi:hypothetical protein